MPKGATINVAPHIMNKHPESWGPSALSFDPERWNFKEDDVAKNPYAFRSFAKGPRMCIGKVVSMREFKWRTSVRPLWPRVRFPS